MDSNRGASLRIPEVVSAQLDEPERETDLRDVAVWDLRRRFGRAGIDLAEIDEIEPDARLERQGDGTVVLQVDLLELAAVHGAVGDALRDVGEVSRHAEMNPLGTGV